MVDIAEGLGLLGAVPPEPRASLEHARAQIRPQADIGAVASFEEIIVRSSRSASEGLEEQNGRGITAGLEAPDVLAAELGAAARQVAEPQGQVAGLTGTTSDLLARRDALLADPALTGSNFDGQLTATERAIASVSGFLNRAQSQFAEFQAGAKQVIETLASDPRLSGAEDADSLLSQLR